MKRTVTLYGIEAEVPDAPEFQWQALLGEQGFWKFGGIQGIDWDAPHGTVEHWFAITEGRPVLVAIAADVAGAWFQRKAINLFNADADGNEKGVGRCHAQMLKWESIAARARKEAK